MAHFPSNVQHRKLKSEGKRTNVPFLFQSMGKHGKLISEDKHAFEYQKGAWKQAIISYINWSFHSSVEEHDLETWYIMQLFSVLVCYNALVINWNVVRVAAPGFHILSETERMRWCDKDSSCETYVVTAFIYPSSHSWGVWYASTSPSSGWLFDCPNFAKGDKCRSYMTLFFLVYYRDVEFVAVRFLARSISCSSSVKIVHNCRVVLSGVAIIY